MKATLKPLVKAYIEDASDAIFHKLKQLDHYKNASSICCYISMPASEVQTYGFIRDAILDGKTVYVPKVIGSRSEDMIITRLESVDSIDSFPKSNWGIPEPTEEYISNHPDVSHEGVLDLILVPGVAFDRNGGRLGHGKGYYG